MVHVMEVYMYKSMYKSMYSTCKKNVNNLGSRVAG